MKITASDIDDLALGAVFLATGGGGDPYLPTLIAKETLAQTGGVTLIDAGRSMMTPSLSPWVAWALPLSR